MAWSGSAFVSEFTVNGGPMPVGIQIDGFLRVTKSILATEGFFIQAADGSYWRVGINVVDGEGVLTTTQVYFP